MTHFINIKKKLYIMSSPNRYNIFCISDTKKCIFYAQQQKREKKDKLPQKTKALQRLLGWIWWLILTLLLIFHEGQVLKRAKVPCQISFKHVITFLAFLIKFLPKTILHIYVKNTFCFVYFCYNSSQSNDKTFQENKGKK